MKHTKTQRTDPLGHFTSGLAAAETPSGVINPLGQALSVPNQSSNLKAKSSSPNPSKAGPNPKDLKDVGSMTLQSKTTAVLNEFQVAELFNCTVQTIQRSARTNRIPGRKVGRKWFFHREVITGTQFLSGKGGLK